MVYSKKGDIEIDQMGWIIIALLVLIISILIILGVQGKLSEFTSGLRFIFGGAR